MALGDAAENGNTSPSTPANATAAEPPPRQPQQQRLVMQQVMLSQQVKTPRKPQQQGQQLSQQGQLESGATRAVLLVLTGDERRAAEIDAIETIKPELTDMNAVVLTLRNPAGWEAGNALTLIRKLGS